jgi:hypothetical protein
MTPSTRVVRVHLEPDMNAGLKKLASAIDRALQ